VGVEKHLGFGHAEGETPLPATRDILFEQSSSGVSEWSSFEVMEAHGDGATKERACYRVSGFEEGSSLDGDELLALQKVGGGIQGDPPPKRSKGSCT